VRARFFQTAQYLTRTWTVHTQVAGRNDAIGTTGHGKIRQTRFQRNRVPVDIRENRYPHLYRDPGVPCKRCKTAEIL
jgi:hypothetical protein